MQQIKVMSSHYPEKPLDYNKWMSKFKVSSRIKEKYVPTERVTTMNKMYDFAQLIKK